MAWAKTTEVSSMKSFLRAFKLIGLGLFIYIITILDWTKVLTMLSHLDILFALLYVLLWFIFYFLRIVRWHLIQKTHSPDIGYKNNLIINIESAFLGYVTPGKFGEIIKIFLMKEYFKIPKKDGLTVYIYDRAQDMLMLGLFAFFGGFFILQYEFNIYIYGLLALFVLVYSFKHIVLNKLSRFYGEIDALTFDGWLETRLFVLNFIIFLLYFLQVYLLAKALSISVGFIELSSVVALGAIVALLPISVSGLGVREGVFVVLLAKYGVGKEEAVALSILDNIVFAALFIFILHLFNKLILNKYFSIPDRTAL